MRAGDGGTSPNWGSWNATVEDASGEREMRCIACGDEMILVHVAQDDRAAAHGYEHHTFSCSKCPEMEQRVVFMKHGRECNIHTAPPAIPELTVRNEHVAPSENLLGRLLAKIREDRWVGTGGNAAHRREECRDALA